jgi:hypothetical protein
MQFGMLRRPLMAEVLLRLLVLALYLVTGGEELYLQAEEDVDKN